MPASDLKAGTIHEWTTLFSGRVLSTTGKVVLRWQPGSGEIMPGYDKSEITIHGQNNPNNKLIARLVAGSVIYHAYPGKNWLQPIGSGEWLHNQYEDSHYIFSGVLISRTIAADRYIMTVDAAVWNL